MGRLLLSVLGKTKSAASGSSFSASLRAAANSAWNSGVPRYRRISRARQAASEPDFGAHKCPRELDGVFDSLAVVRRGLLSNAFLTGWVRWWMAVLSAVILGAVLSTHLKAIIIAAAVALALGAAVTAAWTWLTRPTAYRAACALDSAAGLQDRVSTAVFLGHRLGDVGEYDGIPRVQRQDAISRLAKVNPRALFPVRAPAAANRVLVLIVVAAGFLVYRMYHRPPLVALLETTARSQLVQSILFPIAHAMEKDLQRTVAFMNSTPDSATDEIRPGEQTPSASDLWQTGQDPENQLQEMNQNASDNGDGEQGESASKNQGEQSAMKPGEAPPQEASGDESAESKSNQNMAGNSQKQSDAQSSENSSNQSMGQSLMQAMKNMLSNSPSQQQPQQKSNQPQPNAQGAPQAGTQHQPGSSESDKQGDSKGTSDAQQKASPNSSSGAGSQDGNKELRKDQVKAAGNAVPDRIALEATDFKEKTRMRVNTETGTAKMQTHDVPAQAVTVTNGAEQENIPARYRLYVQHYFEHADSSSAK